MKTELQERADSLVSNLHRSVDACFEVLRSISQLYASSAAVTQQDFRRFVQPALLRHPSIHALEWLPYLKDSDRVAFEQTMQAAGYPSFQVTEQAADSEIIRATQRAEYFPVCYVEPWDSNQSALGFDLASDAIRRSALEKARDTGAITLSGRIELIQEQQKQFGVLVILPIYQQGAMPSTISARRSHLQGFVLGVFRVADILRDALVGLNLNHIDFHLCDRSDSLQENFLAIYQANQKRVIANPDQIVVEGRSVAHPPDVQQGFCHRSFAIADRQWALLLLPTAAYVDRTELYQQSQIRADVATAEAIQLKQTLRDLQQTQTRWLREQKLITLGVGLVLLMLAGVSLTAYANFHQLVESLRGIETLYAAGMEELGQATRSRLTDWLMQAEASIQQIFWMNVVGILGSLILLVGLYYLLRRQIAERQHIESALFQANNQLEIEVQQRTAELAQTKELTDLKQRLFSMVSHEFRTPLSTILVSTQLLASSAEWPEDKKTKNLSRIQTAAKTMAQLLDDLLTLNRAEAGKLEFQPSLIDLEAFCQQLIETVQVSSKRYAPIEFINQASSTQAYLDKKLLHLILINLLSNATKYSASDRPISVILSRTLTDMTLEVRDQGIGIPEMDQQRLFEAFYRAQNVGNIQGSGLGLAIVKTCVDLHNGQITMESQEGVGTTFTIHLPQ